ncbi:MAG: TolC family protein, partial [Deferribacterales bacterium]
KDAEKKLAEIDQNIKIAKYNLMVTLGEEPDDNFDVSEPKKNNDINLNEKELANLAIENRSIIKKMEKDLNTIKNTLEIEKSSYKPIVSLYGGYNYNDSNDAIHPKDGFLLQAGVSFKLDWGKPFSNIKSKKEEIYSYENLIREKKLEVKLSALKAFSDYQIAMQQYKVSLSQVEESEEFYRVMKLKYQNGLISNTDLLSSELTMTNSNMQLKKSFYDILRKLYKLEYEIAQEVM